MIHITFNNNGLRAGLMALLCAIVLSGCGGGGGDYSHRAEERGGEAWKAVETMLADIRGAKTVEAAAEIHCPEGDPKAMAYALGQIRKAKTATLVKLDLFGELHRATVELPAVKPTSRPPKVVVLLLDIDSDNSQMRIVSVN